MLHMLDVACLCTLLSSLYALIASAVTKQQKTFHYRIDVEELDGRRTDSLQTFAVHHWGQWDFKFFGLKIMDMESSQDNCYEGNTSQRHNEFLSR